MDASRSAAHHLDLVFVRSVATAGTETALGDAVTVDNRNNFVSCLADHFFNPVEQVSHTTSCTDTAVPTGLGFKHD